MGTMIVLCAGALGFVVMEPVAWATHRFLMHGPLWSWHRSHHEPREGVFERNDRFALVSAAVSIVLIRIGTVQELPWLQAFGAGVVVYGAAYALLHDGLVHRRWPFRLTVRRGYLGRLVVAHHLHHAVTRKHGGVSFGFLYAPPVPALRRKLASQRADSVLP